MNLFNNFFSKQCTPISNNSTVLVKILKLRKNFQLWNFALMIMLRLLYHQTQIKQTFNMHDKTLHLLNMETITYGFQKLSHSARNGKKIPVLLLPIYGNLLEKIIFTSLSVHLNKDKDVSVDRIKHKYLFYCSSLVVNGCFWVLNSHKYYA